MPSDIQSFKSIPILDLSLAECPRTKECFLKDLRYALLEVGFLYIKNFGIDEHLIQRVISEGKGFFDLPDEKKLAIEMKNVPSFLGYSKLGNEITRFKTDWREQMDLSTSHPLPKEAAPLYHNLLAPNQWPDAILLPNFRPVFESYMQEMGRVSMRFTSLVAEAIGLPADAFDKFFDNPQQHKLKIVKYPDSGQLRANGESQGVGPHKDSMLTSYLLQASHHRGLQVQNHLGEWVDCQPVDGTLVVAIGQVLEALTHGVCQSTTHRVVSPDAGSGPRYSIPFFQGVSYDATFESMDVPENVKQIRNDLDMKKGVRRDDIDFTFKKGRWNHLGEATLMNRIRSHPDVGERWVCRSHQNLIHNTGLMDVEKYPALLEQLRNEESQRA